MLIKTPIAPHEPQSDVFTADRLIFLQGSWEHFTLIQQGCEQTPAAHLFYLDGTIEILMPGRPHEIFSHVIGVLLTLFLAHQKILFFSLGAADQTQKGLAVAQADQSYCLGKEKPIPDLAIEVVFSSGGINKLQLYQTLGVPEVWFWKDGTLAIYHLRETGRETGYDPIAQSELEELKHLDIDILKHHILIAETDLGEAVRSFSAYLQQLA